MADPATEHINTPEEDLEAEANYKPPPEKTIEQILEADKEDESLRKYKETLLGEAKAGAIVVGSYFCPLSISSCVLFKLIRIF